MDPIATNVGIDILNKGGNAIDASIAIATTLAVTSPNWSGLAGDSAWLYHDGKKNINTHIQGYSVSPKKKETDKMSLILSSLLILPLLTSKAIALSRFSKP